MISHLHLHTEYSLLNGAIRISDLAKKAKEFNMPAVAMTDYGNTFGGVEFYKEAVGQGVKPILGAEVFLPNYDDHTKLEFRRGQDQLFHLVLLVQNHQGYQNLCRLLSESYLHGFYYKPRIDTKLLKEFGSDLIVLSGGMSSEINFHLYQERLDLAKAATQKYIKLFPGRFYLELCDNGLSFQQKMNEEIVSLAKEYGLPLVATNDVHYLSPEDAEAFEVLRAIQMSRFYDSDLDKLKFQTDAYHFRSNEEMQELFSYCPESLNNINDIVEKCNFEYDFKTYHFPKFETPEGLTLDDMLIKEAHEGLESRWEQIKLLSHKTDEDKDAYKERLKTELDIICSMGFSGYFLIVSDFIRWAKDQGIPVGPGRGSAAGSLVAYCTHITDLDPIPYNLLFERFLNPERVSMPDVDIDFCQDRRGEVIEYVTEKYGNVSQIITFGKMKAKAVIRDVGRVMDLEYEYVDKIAKLIPGALNIKLKDALEQEPDLKERYENDETVKRLIDVCLKLEGMSRHASVHAAGVIITDKPLWELAPLYKGSDKDLVVQYDMKSAEKIGLIKFDFLGLKTLTVIHNAIKNIKKTRGTDLNIDHIPVDDDKVYQTLISGDGCGIFQLESQGMRDLMTRLKPSCFEDIFALVALYRPGPMDLIPDFIERKHGRQEVDYLDSRLESVLAPTYGIMVYQEQVMQIAQILAGYTLGGADLLRRAMGKKDVNEMTRQRQLFKEGAKKNGLTEERADHIFDLMAKFAGYGFNKSHAAAYALVSYQTAYLKTHYYPEFMAALMTSEMEDTDKLLVFINDLKKHKTRILPPDINFSSKEFTVTDEGELRYALCAIKGVGESAVESIVQARTEGGPFQSYFDFCYRVDLRRVTKKVIEMLIKAGAFDLFDMPRSAMMDAIENMVDAALSKQKSAKIGQGDLFSDEDSQAQTPIGVTVDLEKDWTHTEKLSFEKEAFGFYFSSHPLQPLADHLHKMTTHQITELKEQPQDTKVTLGGVIVGSRAINTKKGDRMAFASLEDLSGSAELVIFPRTYQECREILELEEPLLVHGSIDLSQDDAKIIVESMSKLADTLKETTQSIHIDLPYQNLSEAQIQNVMNVLNQYEGQSLVYLHIKQDDEFETILEFPQKVRATACEPLKYHIDRIFKRSVVRFH